jgi:hypothetical protein
MATAPSAQGIVLIVKTIKAIMKAKIFIGCEGKNTDYKIKIKCRCKVTF